MRTTIDLPEETFRQVKTEAARHGMKLKDLVTELIQSGLHIRARRAHPSRSRSPLPLIRPATGVPHPALTNAQIQAIFDAEEEGHAGS